MDSSIFKLKIFCSFYCTSSSIVITVAVVSTFFYQIQVGQLPFNHPDCIPTPNIILNIFFNASTGQSCNKQGPLLYFSSSRLSYTVRAPTLWPGHRFLDRCTVSSGPHDGTYPRGVSMTPWTHSNQCRS